MRKRDVFAELVEGFDSLKAEREGKLTLRPIEVQGQHDRDALIGGHIEKVAVAANNCIRSANGSQ
jgi:hypothetical protein